MVTFSLFFNIQAKAKSSFGVNYSRRTGMTDEILREAGGSMLTMTMIGCLPDNVQQVSLYKNLKLYINLYLFQKSLLTSVSVLQSVIPTQFSCQDHYVFLFISQHKHPSFFQFSQLNSCRQSGRNKGSRSVQARGKSLCWSRTGPNGLSIVFRSLL